MSKKHVYTDSPDMRRCSSCGKSFKSRAAADQHIEDYHHGNAERVTADRTKAPDYEPSVAEELVDAELAHACGEAVPEHIAAMFPDKFR